jgi:hypothetical protein
VNECILKTPTKQQGKTMFRIEIENQDKKMVVVFKFVGTLKDAMKVAEEQRGRALASLVSTKAATAFIWNLNIGGIDAMLDEDGWDL